MSSNFAEPLCESPPLSFAQRSSISPQYLGELDPALHQLGTSMKSGQMLDRGGCFVSLALPGSEGDGFRLRGMGGGAKTAWEIGGLSSAETKNTNAAGSSNMKYDLLDSYFLGPPLPLFGKLYVLNEKSNLELRLVCIDPSGPEPKICWIQPSSSASPSPAENYPSSAARSGSIRD